MTFSIVPKPGFQAGELHDSDKVETSFEEQTSTDKTCDETFTDMCRTQVFEESTGEGSFSESQEVSGNAQTIYRPAQESFEDCLTGVEDKTELYSSLPEKFMDSLGTDCSDESELPIAVQRLCRGINQWFNKLKGLVTTFKKHETEWNTHQRQRQKEYKNAMLQSCTDTPKENEYHIRSSQTLVACLEICVYH